MTTVRTFGHGTLPADEFASIVTAADIDEIVAVRTFPGSRHNPQFKQAEMEAWLPRHGLGYRWVSDLGGRRKPVEGSRHVALRHPSFRVYADHMETSEFAAGIETLLRLAQDCTPAIMCSESVWWRCHRRLVADHLVLVEGIEVLHLMHDGRLTEHAPTDGVRLDDAGTGLVYDVGATPPLPAD